MKTRPMHEGRDLDNWLAMAEQFNRRGLTAQANDALSIAKMLNAAELALRAGVAGKVV